MSKTHLQRWAPQDYRTSRVRARSATTRDPVLRLVYLEALNALWEAGGSLSADPAFLADEFLLPAKEIARCLPILDSLARSGSGRGGIFVEEGRIYNGRVRDDLQAEHAFREKGPPRGERGGERPAEGPPNATQKKGDAPPTPPPPFPFPAPSLFPAPLPEPDPLPTSDNRKSTRLNSSHM